MSAGTYDSVSVVLFASDALSTLWPTHLPSIAVRIWGAP
ncbi:hypothetical protein AKJ09_00547 [Labilithrix luteola]|uniref:Uncharacterized protein n=1 Tax=Labilithrix luteola TaxID=1391654 RepID=A0A0K1PK14_9BACT|nr:hypothetical protein AKJ09_00547 [Labilithrix luteola]